MTTTSQEYYDWISKFANFKTSDDTFTPPEVYDCVLDYVHTELVSLDGLNVVRPFYPGGDYQAAASDYDDKTIVIDNPPFSIITKIIKFYLDKNIKFFLFVPALTAFNAAKSCQGLTYVITGASIRYANGAVVNSAFVHNLTPGIKVTTASSLHKTISQAQKNPNPLPKYSYPPELVTVSRLQAICRLGLDYELAAHECQFISRLDSQKAHKKTIYGGGLLISRAKAKELQVKELQVKTPDHIWQLSEQEQAIIDSLGKETP